MATLTSRLMRAQIALLYPLIKRMDLDLIRKLQDALGALGSRVLSGTVQYEEKPFEHFEAAWASLKDPVPGKAVLYLHGGSYTAGTLMYAKGFGGVIAEQTGFRTLCVGYRLAPEHPFPAALEDAVSAYRAVLEDHEACNVAFVGESAGGGLCFALALKLKELGLPQPGCICAISPWTDLTMSLPSCTANEAVDPILSSDSLRYSAHLYAREAVMNPLVSPLLGTLDGLPPSLIFAGTDEILKDDASMMAEKLRESGCPCELVLQEGMWHVYVLYGIHEAKEAISRMRDFIWEGTGHGEEKT